MRATFLFLFLEWVKAQTLDLSAQKMADNKEGVKARLLVKVVCYNNNCIFQKYSELTYSNSI